MTETTKRILTGVLDAEPTWKSIARAMLPPDRYEALQPALEIADTVRQAQKSGAKSVTFRFENKNGPVAVEVEK